MLNKELFFLKKNWKRYVFIIVMLAFVIGYFVYKETESAILMFLSFSLPGLLVSLQTVQNSIMQEKNNGMFEKLLTVYNLDRILTVKAFVSFSVSVIVTLICSGIVGLILHFGGNAVLDSSIFLCELSIALCVDWTISVLLVILYMFIDQIIVINACVMAVMMLLSAICFGVVTAESMMFYTIGYCVTIVAVGSVLAFLIKYVPNTTALR